MNLRKREQRADLKARVALVTGARVKIGYRVALKLLRDGAFVIATTRFPHDAARRFSGETDFGDWRDRLKIYGIDFRQIAHVEQFTEYLRETYARLDILINNAAQTVRRPPAFYEHLIEFERTPAEKLPAALRAILDSAFAARPVFKAENNRYFPLTETAIMVPGAENMAPSQIPASSAELSQIAVLPEDEKTNSADFPRGEFDEFGQQIDQRGSNSWTMKMEDVSLPELLETQLVSSIAPFVLISRLKPLMTKSPAESKFIVNVSSMEGVFNRQGKSVYHPHTNMAKASLNMLTRTSARDFAKDGIYLNAVDTGWITDENPYPLAEKMKADGFVPPLGMEDAVARIIDPVYLGINEGKNEYGKFLKDFKISEW